MLTKKHKEEFRRLACCLSPENLSHDGERSQAQIAAAEKQLLKEWTVMERRAGRKVEMDEVWEWD